MKVWHYLLILLMISGTFLYGSRDVRLGLSDDEYESLERLAQRFGPKTYTKVHILPEDDELNKVRRTACRVGEGLIEQARTQYDLEKKGNLIDQGIRWLCMAESLLDNQAWGALQSLARSACWGDIHTQLMDDLRVSYGDYIHQYWSPTYYREAKSLYFTAMKHPAGYHELNRTWDWLERMVGMRVLPPAEERIAQRVEEFEKMMALLEGRRFSDASTESADSADTADTEPLLGSRAETHLKAE